MTSKSYLDGLTYAVNGAAIEVHKALGPGLLESVYHNCLAYELTQRKIQFESERRIPISYKELKLEAYIRCDFIIENVLALELKSAESVLPIHQAQLLTYMKLLQVPKGMLLNFNVTNLIQHGQRTFVNEYFAQCPA